MSTATETSVDRTVAPKQLIALIKDAEQKGKRIQSISGELGERVKNAVENGHLHRGAFRLMLRLYKMDEEKRGDFMRSIGLYMQICHEEGLFGRETGDMFEGNDEAANEPEADESAPNEHGSVSADSEAGQEILSGIKPLDEEAPKRARRSRKKAALEGAEAEGSYTSVN
jgi:uncharacterized protein (UPF0335 family)